MNYQKIYNKLINKGKNRILLNNIYFESHHIIPKCLGGTDEKSNLVDLTPEEHYLAHQLLVKIYPNNRKLITAIIRMSTNTNSNSSRRKGNKLYGWLRRKAAELQTGPLNHRYGKKHTEEWKDERRKFNKLHDIKPPNQTGAKRTEETKKRISESLKGRKLSEEHRKKCKLGRSGKKFGPLTLKVKEKIKNTNKITWKNLSAEDKEKRRQTLIESHQSIYLFINKETKKEYYILSKNLKTFCRAFNLSIHSIKNQPNKNAWEYKDWYITGLGKFKKLKDLKTLKLI